ncbi:MAG: hypothetical protein QOD00_1900, partial [Blastocatellia bacterium]|nr:hypothetical protein [Blastocatellia bacterium]
SLIKSHLKLSGVVCRENGILRVRNPIYREVFNEKWIAQHLPPSWTKKQLARAKRIQFALIALLILVALLTLLVTVLAIKANIQTRIANEQTRLAQDSAKREAEARQEAVLAKNEALRAAQSEAEARHVAEMRRQQAEKAANTATLEGRQAVQAATREKKAHDEAVQSAHREAVARKEANAQFKLAEEALKREEKASALAEDARNEALKQTREADAQRQLAENRANTERLYLEAFDVTRSGHPEKALEKFEKALELYQHSDDPVGKSSLASAHRRIGEIYIQLSTTFGFDEERKEEMRKLALQHFNSARQAYHEANEPLGEALAYELLGGFYASQTTPNPGVPVTKERADDSYIKAAEIYEKYGSYSEAASAYVGAGQIVLNLEDGLKADGYFKKAVETSQLTGDRKLYASTLNSLGEIYYKKYTDVLRLYFHTLSTIFEMPLRKDLSKEQSDKISKVMREAAVYYSEASKVYHDLGDARSEALALRQSAYALYYAGENMNAIAAMQDALTVFRAANITSEIGIALVSLGRLYEEVGDYQKALQAYKDGYPYMLGMDQTGAKQRIEQLSKQVGGLK